MDKKYYAHSSEGKSISEWQLLETHLTNVAVLAKSFAESFDAGDWGYLAGLWHDLGKYSDAFQKMLGSQGGRLAQIENFGHIDHSSAGAQHAFNTLKDKGKILAYAIAGHHAGLMDGKSNEACLCNRLSKTIPDYSACPEDILHYEALGNLPFEPNIANPTKFGFQISLFIRMIYSCLVDADFLDTEAFMDREKSLWRKGYPSLSDLASKLDTALQRLIENSRKTPINKYRAEILQDCLNSAERPQGLFSLTVPTGGGKTLSSLAFAMQHSLTHNLKRIIYVIPYTSIIEQNADVFRQILGRDAVLEHHSNFEPTEEDCRSRLASENWDAPVVVTTNIQFFESLYRCRSSKCRKIHNIASSVVILDEAQMLPVHLLKPCLEVLRELSATYNTSVVLCTATQPALSTTESFRDGLDNVHEIASNPGKLYHELKRVRVEQLSLISDGVLSARLREHEQVLCIVNTRAHARHLFECIHSEIGDCYHLSALMCPEHRTLTLNKIRSALRNGSPCRVISTQLIEAGVDIDFPVVFRAVAGIDSIAQAAGRCNREGQLQSGGQLFVFSPEKGLPPGYFRQAAQNAESVMRHHDDILSPEAVNEYFRMLYWMKGELLDEYGILDDLGEGVTKGDFPFRAVDEKFKIIREGAESVIVPWSKEAETIISSLRYAKFPASFARQAQRFTVQVYPQTLVRLECAGSVERLHGQYCVLLNMDIYRDDLGLCPEEPTFHEIENLIF